MESRPHLQALSLSTAFLSAEKKISFLACVVVTYANLLCLVVKIIHTIWVCVCDQTFGNYDGFLSWFVS